MSTYRRVLAAVGANRASRWVSGFGVLLAALVLAVPAFGATWKAGPSIPSSVWLAGSADSQNFNWFLMAGGLGFAHHSSTYAALRQTWFVEGANNGIGYSAGPLLPSGRGGAGVVYDPTNDVIYTIGGQTAAAPPRVFSTVLRLVGDAGAWTTAAPLPVPRTLPGAAAATDGRVFVIGGYGPPSGSTTTATDAVTVYDPSTNTWTAGPPLPVAIGEPAVATGPDGKIYAAGGWTRGVGAQRSVEALDPSNPGAGWVQLTPMPAPHDYAAATFYAGKFYVVGGWDGRVNSRRVDVYDPAANTWSCTVPLRVGRTGISLGQQGGLFTVVGGISGRYVLSSTEHLNVRGLGPDTVKPTVTQHPTPSIVMGQAPLTGMRFVVNWGVTDGQTDILNNRLQYSNDNGRVWGDVTGIWPALRPVWFTVSNVNMLRYRVTPQDCAGNSTVPAAGLNFSTRVVNEQHGMYAGGWPRVRLNGSQGGYVRYSSRAGATDRYTFVGREVAWLAARGPKRGAARIFIDGRPVSTVHLYARSFSPRMVVFRRAFSRIGRHVLTIRVVGTPGHPRVDVDGYFVIGAPTAGVSARRSAGRSLGPAHPLTGYALRRLRPAPYERSFRPSP